MTLIEVLTFGEDSKPRRLLGCGAAFAKGSAEDVTKENKKTSKQANNRLSHNVKEDAMAALVRRRGNVVGYIYNDVQKNIGNHKEQLMTPKKKTRLD